MSLQSCLFGRRGRPSFLGLFGNFGALVLWVKLHASGAAPPKVDTRWLSRRG
jgi:hypothetical protein